MSAEDKKAVLEAVNSYMASISVKPPFTEAYNYVHPRSYAVISRPGKVWHFTLNDFVPHLEQMLSRVYQAGLTCVVHLTKPGPDIWVHDKLAALWCGYSSDVNGKEVGRGVMAFTLVRGQEKTWKIVSVVDDQFKPGAETPEAVSKPTPELITRTSEFIRLFNKTEDNNSELVTKLLLSGGGVTILGAESTLLTPKWEDSFAQLRSELKQSDESLEQRLSGGDGRSMGDLGLLWLPSTPTTCSEIGAGRSQVFTLFKKNEDWLISGFQSG